jgi:hypothetical protein
MSVSLTDRGFVITVGGENYEYPYDDPAITI